jgi:hypothetical protein
MGETAPSPGILPPLLYRNLWPLQFSADQVREIALRLQQVDPEAKWRVVETARSSDAR